LPWGYFFLKTPDKTNRTTGPVAEGPSSDFFLPWGYLFLKTPGKTNRTTGPVAEGPSSDFFLPGVTFSSKPRTKQTGPRVRWPKAHHPTFFAWGYLFLKTPDKTNRTTGPVAEGPSSDFFCLGLPFPQNPGQKKGLPPGKPFKSFIFSNKTSPAYPRGKKKW